MQNESDKYSVSNEKDNELVDQELNEDEAIDLVSKAPANDSKKEKNRINNEKLYDQFNFDYLELKEHEHTGPNFIITRTTGMIRQTEKPYEHEEDKLVEKMHPLENKKLQEKTKKKQKKEEIEVLEIQEKKEEIFVGKKNLFWFTSSAFDELLSKKENKNLKNDFNQDIEKDNELLNQYLNLSQEKANSELISLDLRNEKDRMLLFRVSCLETKKSYWDIIARMNFSNPY